jgi:hypothetical protein
LGKEIKKFKTLLESGQFTGVKEKQRDRARERFLHTAFNITPLEWDRISDHQGGVCFACGRKSVGKRLATDHSHDTGLLRGLLCNSCNSLLGKIENNFKRYGLHKVPGMTVVKVLLAFAAYLTNPPATAALGHQVFGYPGKIGTIAYRKWAKKKAVPIDMSNERT